MPHQFAGWSSAPPGDRVGENRQQQPQSEVADDHLADDDDLAEARLLLQDRTGAASLSSSSRLAWLQEGEGIQVFANGESRLFPGAVLQKLVALCENRGLEAAELAGMLDNPTGVELLDFLLETGCLYVE